MKKYAIIGFGGLGKIHLANLIELERERGDIKLVAICGADPKTFKQNVKINLGTVDIGSLDFDSCNFYVDYKELIDKEAPDFIVSAVPTYLHEEVAAYALLRGIHIFSEKPMALSVDGCDRMISLAKSRGLVLMIGQCLRFDPAFTLLKELISSEKYGKAYRAEFVRYSELPMWSWNNWILDPEKSGGCVLDMHIHDVDLINWFFGTPKTLRSAVTEKKAELEAIFTQYFYDELLVTSAADWSLPSSFPFDSRCQINFENACAVISGGELTIYSDGEKEKPKLSLESAFVSEMREFLAQVIDGAECSVISAESVRDSVKLAKAEILSAKLGQSVEPETVSL